MTELSDAHFELHSANKDKMNNMNKFFIFLNSVNLLLE